MITTALQFAHICISTTNSKCVSTHTHTPQSARELFDFFEVFYLQLASNANVTWTVYATYVTIWIFIFVYNWTKLTAPTTPPPPTTTTLCTIFQHFYLIRTKWRRRILLLYAHHVRDASFNMTLAIRHTVGVLRAEDRVNRTAFC